MMPDNNVPPLRIPIGRSTAAHWQVVVIGAGVAGGLAATLCARAGLQTLLVEKHTFPRHKVCGCCLSHRALTILQQAEIDLGFDHGAAAQPPITSVRFHVARQQAAIRVPPGRAISRGRLDQQLVRAARQAGCHFLDHTTATVLPDESPPTSQGVDIPGDRPRRIELRQTDHAAATRAPPLRAAVPAPQDHLQTVTADLVLACDGLGQPSLGRLPDVPSRVMPQARIGLGGLLPNAGEERLFPAGEIQMAVTRHGYAGIVRTETGQLNLAAAVDAGFLQQQTSPAAALQTLLQEAGPGVPAGLSTASLRGTPLLTRRSPRIAARRLFLLGDATGYVEPFTGEGMTWALSAAVAVLPLVRAAVTSGWTPELAAAWQLWHAGHLGRCQQSCRLLSATLRRPWLLQPLLLACRTFPGAAGMFADRLHRAS